MKIASGTIKSQAPGSPGSVRPLSPLLCSEVLNLSTTVMKPCNKHSKLCEPDKCKVNRLSLLERSEAPSVSVEKCPSLPQNI